MGQFAVIRSSQKLGPGRPIIKSGADELRKNHAFNSYNNAIQSRNTGMKYGRSTRDIDHRSIYTDDGASIVSGSVFGDDTRSINSSSFETLVLLN